MPDVDGFQVSERINLLKKFHAMSQNGQNQHLSKYKVSRQCPVVAITAFQGPNIEKQARAAGIVDVLYKPVECQLFNSMLDIHLGKVSCPEESE